MDIFWSYRLDVIGAETLSPLGIVASFIFCQLQLWPNF